MAAGLHGVNLANKWLDLIGNNTSFTAVAQLYVKLHTGDPGAAGTANASANTTRQAVNFAAAAGGSMTADNVPQWAAWSSGTETITHISLWDASTAGNFLWSIDSGDKTVLNGDDLSLTVLTLALVPVAA